MGITDRSMNVHFGYLEGGGYRLFDRRGAFKVTMPPSEFGLDTAKEKALISARYYMQRYGGDRTWTQPTSVDWREFTPRSVICET